MKTNFKSGDTVKVNGAEKKIVNVKKDFPSQKILYRLDDKTVISDEALVKMNTPTAETVPSDIDALRMQIEKLSGQAVPDAFKKDKKWMKKELARLEKITAPTNDNAVEINADVILAADAEGLSRIIAEKELDIVADDYEIEDLRKAIAEELEITLEND